MLFSKSILVFYSGVIESMSAEITGSWNFINSHWSWKFFICTNVKSKQNVKSVSKLGLTYAWGSKRKTKHIVEIVVDILKLRRGIAFLWKAEFAHTIHTFDDDSVNYGFFF